MNPISVIPTTLVGRCEGCDKERPLVVVAYEDEPFVVCLDCAPPVSYEPAGVYA
jgi:hypothetical protein